MPFKLPDPLNIQSSSPVNLFDPLNIQSSSPVNPLLVGVKSYKKALGNTLQQTPRKPCDSLLLESLDDGSSNCDKDDDTHCGDNADSKESELEFGKTTFLYITSHNIQIRLGALALIIFECGAVSLEENGTRDLFVHAHDIFHF